jgi:hypothetical protein
MSFELSEIRFGTLKLTCDSSVHQPQVSIVHHDHLVIVIVTWLALISSCTNRREAISEKEFSNSRFNFLFSRKILQHNLSWLHKAFSSLATLKEGLLKDRSSLTSESESDMFLEDLPTRQRTVKSPCLRLTFSSSSKLEESSLEKSESLKAAHARDMIF